MCCLLVVCFVVVCWVVELCCVCRVCCVLRWDFYFHNSTGIMVDMEKELQ